MAHDLPRAGRTEVRGESSSFSFSCPFLASPNIYIHLSHWSLLPTDPVPVQTPVAKGTAPKPNPLRGNPPWASPQPHSSHLLQPPLRNLGKRGMEYSLRRDSPSRLKELGFLTCWQLQRQDGGASSPEFSSYTWGKGGAGRGRARAFSLSHPNYCSLLGWEPALCAPPSL